MSKLSIVIFGLTLWGLMLLFCVPHDAHHIQHDVNARTALLLAERNISPEGLEKTINVDGRDVTLTGYAGSPEVSDQTTKLVSAIWGVRSVRRNILSRLETAKPVITQQEAREAASSINSILKLQSVEFYSGTQHLTPLGQNTLNQVAKVLRKYPGMSVEIAGYTDSHGRPKANLQLSQRRAASVKKYLIEKGISGASLRDVGFGEAQPIASNKTAAGRQENRRVEFHTKGTK